MKTSLVILVVFFSVITLYNTVYGHFNISSDTAQINSRPVFTNCPSGPIVFNADENTTSSNVTWNDLRISVDEDTISPENVQIEQIDGPAQNTVQEEGSYLVQYESMVEDTFIRCAFLVQVRVTRCYQISLCIEHGRFICSQNNTIFGSTCSFICDAGYTRNGPENVKCLSTGIFEESRPTCELITAPEFVNCPVTVVITAGENMTTATASWPELTAVGYNVNIQQINGPTPGTDLMEGVYDVQYEAVDEFGNRAEDCVFTVEVEVIRCNPIFLHIENGGFECSEDSIIWGTICLFSCNEGYTRSGSQTVRCVPPGVFDGPNPACEEKQLVCQQNVGLYVEESDLCFTVTPTSNAEEACHDRLVYVDNPDLDQYLATGLAGAFVFIDGNYNANDSTWVTSTGEVMTYFNWGTGQPDILPSENCIALDPQLGNKWADVPCQTASIAFAACQIDV